MLTYSFSNMAAAKKAMEALKSYGFTNVFLDADDSFHSDTEFGFKQSMSSSSLTGHVYGSNYYAYHPGKGPLTASDPFVSGMSSYEHRDLRTVLRVEEGAGDPSMVSKIISEYMI